MLRRLISEDIEIDTILSPNLGLAKVAYGQISQVLMNLAINSQDAMPNGGRLVIETANETMGTSHFPPDTGLTPGEYVVLTVSDNGVGMSPEVRSHIFEPFFTTKEVGQGTGLGLATCYGIVTQSGGHIDVSGEENQGTVIKIYFPTCDDAGATGVDAEGTGSECTGDETVLLVEDASTVRSLVARVLRQQGYKVLEARDGEEALRVARSHGSEQIHLLLTDMVMPRMGGPELVERLKLLRPDTKALLTSGYIDANINSGFPPGADFIQKPYTPETVLSKVREVLES